MRSLIDRLFLDHPRSVNETYFEHLSFAFSFAGTLFFAAAAALVHAFIPSLCEKTASTAVKNLQHKMASR